MYDYSAKNGIKSTVSGNDSYMDLNNSSFGGFIFVDLTYIEANIGLAFGKINTVIGLGGSSISGELGSVTQFGVSILGKYPIGVGFATFFPLIGISFNAITSMKDSDGTVFTDAEDLSQFGVQAGVGLDFNLSGALFIRGEALLQFRFPSKFIQDNVGTSATSTLGVGPVLKLAIGYQF
jgi:outer membrane protein W